MRHFLLLMLSVVALVASAPLLAASSKAACGTCSKESQFSWNPSKRFVNARLLRFYNLDSLIDAAYKAKDFKKVKKLAKEDLALAAVYRCNWNYGNAIHHTNRILGLVSLREGDVDGAAKYLLQAGKSPGSPQLDTFGPNLDLANQLLQRGKVAAVTAYLHEIKSFWTMDRGQIATWLAQIKSGKKPKLDRFAAAEPGPFMVFLGWLLMGWPVVVSALWLYAQRQRIKRRILFFIVAVLSGYAVVYVGGWALEYGVQKIFADAKSLGELEANILIYMPLVLMFLLPVLTAFAEARWFYSVVNERP